MAVTANQVARGRLNPSARREGDVASGAHLYENTLAFYTAADGNVKATFGAGDVFAGVNVTEVHNDAAALPPTRGTKCDLRTKGTIWVTVSGLTAANIGDIVHATDNFTVAGSGGAPCGKLLGISGTLGEVDLNEGVA